MLRPNDFVVQTTGGEDVNMFHAATKKAYRFPVGLDELAHLADQDEDTKRALLASELLTAAPDYIASAKRLLEQRKLRAAKTLNVTYTVTTVCGMNCRYCFERHLHRQHSTQDHIDRFLDRVAATFEAQPIIANLYVLIMGGEPLLRPDLVTRLVRGVIDVTDRYDKSLILVMTTNGLIGDAATLDSLHEEGLRQLQVTFDGPERLHDRFRPQSYAPAMANLPELTRRFSTAIKHNLSRASCQPEAFAEFLADLVDLGLDPNQYLLEFEPVEPSLGQPDVNDELFLSMNGPAVADTIIELVKMALEKDVPASIGPVLRAPCVLTNDNSVMIEPDGTVRRCLMAYGSEHFLLGHLDELPNLVVEKDDIRQEVLEAVRGHCANVRCPFLPICETGCMLMKRAANRPPGSATCRRNFYARFIPQLTEIMLKRRLATQGV